MINKIAFAKATDPKAIRKTAAPVADGKTTSAKGVHVDEGIGPNMRIKGYIHLF